MLAMQRNNRYKRVSPKRVVKKPTAKALSPKQHHKLPAKAESTDEILDRIGKELGKMCVWSKAFKKVLKRDFQIEIR